MQNEMAILLDLMLGLPMWAVGFGLYYFERKERIAAQKAYEKCLEKIIISECVQNE